MLSMKLSRDLLCTVTYHVNLRIFLQQLYREAISVVVLQQNGHLKC